MLSVLSWNIQSARSPSGGADLDGVLTILDRFAPGAEVLCLQEVACGYPARDGSPGGDQFAGLARRLPGWHCASAYAVDTPAPDGGRRRLGSMVFSRHPILQVLRHSLPWPADPAVPSMPRIALETVLDTPSGPLRLLNVHLEYFSEVQRLAQLAALRRLQIDATAHARGAGSPGSDAGPGADPDSPFAAMPRPSAAVLVGDFNMLPGSRSHLALLEPFTDDTPPWRDAWQLAYPGRAHAPTVGLHDPGGAPFTFDYAFVSADLAARVRGLRIGRLAQGSDHQPLVLELG
jgi:endonuclease/exonuclease/phosphatase family metal-dependent hydrolase